MCGVCVGVLCVWIYVVGVYYFDDCDGVCDDCGDVFFVECGELLLVVDVVFVGGVDSGICVFVFGVLFLYEDEDVWVFLD